MIPTESLTNLTTYVPRIEPRMHVPEERRRGPQDVRQRIAWTVLAGAGSDREPSALSTAIADARRPFTFDPFWAPLLAYGAAIAGLRAERSSGVSGVAVRAALERAQPYVSVQSRLGLRSVADIDFGKVSTDTFLWSTAGIVAAARPEPFERTRPTYAWRLQGLDTAGHQRVIRNVVDICTQLVDQHVAYAAVVRTLRNSGDLLLSVHLETVPFGRRLARDLLRKLITRQEGQEALGVRWTLGKEEPRSY